MKKLHILIPSLVATVGMPFISLTSCGNKKKIDKVKIFGKKEVLKGEETTYSAEVTVLSDKPDHTVTWSISSGQSETGSTIDPNNGKFTAGNEVGKVVIKATSVLDNTKSDEFTINVVADIKSVSIVNQTQALPARGETDYVATVETTESEDKKVIWKIDEDKSSTGSTITSSGHFVAGAKEGKVVIRVICVANTSKFATLDVYVHNTCPLSSVELDSDNAIVFGQSTVVKTKAVSTIDDIYVAIEVVGCDVGETDAIWDAATSTLTAGEIAGNVTITCKPVGYTNEYTCIIYIAQNIFKYSIVDGDATITGLEKENYKRVSVLPTIVDKGIDYNVTTIGEGALNYEKITAINLRTATNLAKIKNNAFVGSAIESIYIPKGVQSIDSFAFEWTKIRDVFIEEGSQLKFSGEDSVFSGKTSEENYLETINFENASQNTCIPKNFIQWQPIKSITIPVSITKICDWAFWHCANLSTINFLGTKQQWKSIQRDYGSWHQYAPAKTVHCIDGDCGLDDTSENN